LGDIEQGKGTDPVVDALERALVEAVAGRDWARAEVLAREIAAREKALAASNVVSMPRKKHNR
jgi:hypothetical protein